MRGGNYLYRHLARIVPVSIGVLCIFASSAHVLKSGSAQDGASRFKTDALYARVGSVSVKDGKSDSHKHLGKKRSKAKSGKRVSKKRSSAGASDKIHARAKRPIHREQVGIFTAYTASAKKDAKKRHITADQTDLKRSSACVVANNKLRLGTKIRIEGIGTCEVHDRIGKRVRANRFDIFMDADPKCAKDFGKRRLKYTVEHGGKTS